MNGEILSAETIEKIARLEKENKKLKSQLDFIGEQNKYIDKLEKKLDMEKKINENNTNAYLKILHSEEAYKSRIEKAVKYNYKLQERYCHSAIFDELVASKVYEISEKNINILQGGKDE